MRICPVCGERHVPVGSDPDTAPAFACPGPKVSWPGTRELRDVRLVEWGPDTIGYAEQAAADSEEDG